MQGEMGLNNVELIIPLVCTLDLVKGVNEMLESNGLKC